MPKPDRNHDAFRLTVEDPAIRSYLQRYPFADGPDKATNARCLQIIRDRLTARSNVPTGAPIVWLEPNETPLTAEQMARLKRIMDESGLPAEARPKLINDYAWEASLIPPGTKSALVIGCGDGVELMFMRAVLPEAKITALDYDDFMSPECKNAVGARFFQGDFHALLAGFGQEFDLISSNHTLEHLYTPEEILAMLAGLLVDHGALISTLPMDATPDSPFREKVLELTTTKNAHLLDLVYLDAGHPWKTNPADLNATLQEAGFEPPRLYQRREHLSRVVAGSKRRFKAQLFVGRTLHTFFFALPRWFAKTIFPNNPPGIVTRSLQGAERRMWFGTNQLKNRYTQEVLVLAYKRARAV